MKLPNFQISSWMARNPLGIIALFISLIYGMSAVLLGATINNLALASQGALVAFIVLFPCAVLWVFAWLVSRHHTKLYGPGDYRTDTGFLNAGRPTTGAEIGKRLQDELEIAASEERASTSSDLTPEEKLTSAIFSGTTSRTWRLSQAYLAEGLVFQALQAELGGSVRREVTVADRGIDGLIFEPTGQVTAVEIKIVSGSATKNITKRILDAQSQLEPVKVALALDGILNVRLLLVFVVDGNPGRVAELKAQISDRSFPIDVRVFGLSELIDRYGFSGAEPTSGPRQ